jgi:uncharacterized protein (TIGR00369 family)
MRVSAMNEQPVSERMPPPGFFMLPMGLGFNDAFAPVYINIDGADWHAGFFVEQHHLNPQGVCHGGVLMSFIDLAMAGAIGHHINDMMGMFTTNMTVDFIAKGSVGDWLQFQIDHVHATRLLGTISGRVMGPSGIVARANGTFRLPKKSAEKI